MQIDILHPQKEFLVKIPEVGIENNNSIVFMLKYKLFKALFTADIQRESEELLIKKEGEAREKLFPQIVVDSQRKLLGEIKKDIKDIVSETERFTILN